MVKTKPTVLVCGVIALMHSDGYAMETKVLEKGSRGIRFGVNLVFTTFKGGVII